MEHEVAVLLEGEKYYMGFILPGDNCSPICSNLRAVSFQRKSGHDFEED